MPTPAISIPGHEILNLIGEGGMAQVWAGARLGAGNSIKPRASTVETRTALTCNAAATVTVRNSLVVSRDAGPEVVCSGVIASNTAAEAVLGGAGNVALGDMSTTWFQDFNAGDLHLTTPPIAVATAARWEDGDPVGDIDGDERVQLDGAPDVAGADVP